MIKFFKFDKSLFKVSSSVGTLSLFSLLFPMLFESIANYLLGTVNTIVLSDFSEVSVAAVGAANSVLNIILIVASVFSLGTTIVISNCLGAENLKKAKEVAFAALFVSISIMIIAATGMFIFSRQIMEMLNLKGALLQDAVTYFNIRLIFMMFFMATTTFLALLKCYGFAKYTFLIGLLTNIINLILSVYVIYFPQYSPVDGVAGVALSYGISSVISCIVAACIVKVKKIKIAKPESFKDFFHHTLSILKIGVPSGFSSTSVTVSYMVTTAFVALIGDYALSAKVYYATILDYVYLFSVSAGNANALMVGRCCGAGDFERAEKMNRQLVKITTPVNLLISLAVILLRRPLLGLFTDDSLIISLALGVFAVDIITEQARAISQVYEYSLRAAGDVVFTTVIMIISCWVCNIGLSYFLSIKCGLGIVGLWVGLATDETVRAIVTYFRWKSGKWKKQFA